MMPQDTAQRPCLQKAHERQRQGEKDRQCREAVIRSINASAGLSALTRPAGAAPPPQARDEQTRRFAELTDEAKASLQVGVTQESSRVDVQGPRARDTEGELSCLDAPSPAASHLAGSVVATEPLHLRSPELGRCPIWGRCLTMLVVDDDCSRINDL